MPKIDLDDLEKRLDCDMHCNQDVTDLMEELRAARAVVEEARSHVDAAFILQTVLKEYDEVTNG